MSFDQRKASMLASLTSSTTDKSPKGSLDTPIIPLLNLINTHSDYFTTSSCSGRISVFSHPINRRKGGSWLFITHDPTTPSALLPLLFPGDTSEDQNMASHLVFRFEPLIVAVECRDVEAAERLVSFAVASGLRESGVTSIKRRVIVGIRSSMRLEVPLGEVGGVLVSEEYLRFLVGVANGKMEENRKRADGFFKALIGSGGFGGSKVGELAGENGGNEDVDDGGKEIDGQAGVSRGSLSITQIEIDGEPVEKLFLWGHTACLLENLDRNYKILVFGGFGGIGRHSRRNDTLVLDPLHGTLEAINCESSPSPRLGHTSCLVGNQMFVIGGRADPLNILSDVWVFSTAENKWRLVECAGSTFPPRHRHAAVTVGSNIYVFGGLNNDTVSSSLHVLDTRNMEWKEFPVNETWPSARHSHSMVAYGSQIYMFGGHSGDEVLGDLYSFDVSTCLWKKEEVAGRSPRARFSHSMFLYKNYIGLIGGCPVVHQGVLTLFDLQLRTWKYVKLDSMIKEMVVRFTSNVIRDELIVIGGGAACYAFGTKFSDPMKINLLPLETMSLDDWHVPSEPCRNEEKNVYDLHEGVTGEMEINSESLQIGNAETLNRNSWPEPEPNNVNGVHQMVASYWVLQLDKKYAKLGKDILKKFGWLDLVRKAYPKKDGHICFPVSEKFIAVFNEKQHLYGNETEVLNNFQLSHKLRGEGILLTEISSSKALEFLQECGATKLPDEVVEVKRSSKSPLKIMMEAVASLIQSKSLPDTLLDQLPSRWERLGDIVLLPVTAFKDPIWDSIGDKLWPVVAKSLNATRLARQGRVAPTSTRDSTLELLVGDNGWVSHCENGIIYSFDATKCMFSWGNLSEKLRMGRLCCKDEVIVDLFAGIGYFVLPFLVRAKAKLVYACEWNPHSVEALKYNLQVNSVSDRCIVLEGDNRINAPKGVADRVCLGLIPSSENSWVTAVRALRTEGGMLHVHGNVKDSEEGQWTEHVSGSISEIAKSEGYCWEVTVEHVERVKWYAPHIRHLVADVRCRQIQQ